MKSYMPFPYKIGYTFYWKYIRNFIRKIVNGCLLRNLTYSIKYINDITDPKKILMILNIALLNKK